MVGKTLLHYEIVESIGKGGMGEVFRARDTKLGREVALKILPPELIGDPEREARFQREARALASLQHPNVASVYGFEEAEGFRFLVMELVSGAELTRRMGQGPLPVAETLNIARQVAAGLEAAHESGIVHRDLKPANVMISNEGEVKILDFGLAQAWFGELGEQKDSATNPTLTAAMTQVGAILGTAAYMSPEQARGSAVDRRADIWAFGVILFEMLTGKQLFHGDTISDTLAAVLRAEPEWDLLPVDEAPTLCHLIERCLERNPKQRLRDIGEARIFLQDGDVSGTHLSFSRIGMMAAPAEPARAGFPLLLVAAVAVAALTLGGALGWKVLARPEPAQLLHAMIAPPEGMEFDLRGVAPGTAAISPSGTMVVFAARNDEGTSRLYLRHLDKGESVALSGTEGAAYPFWSPDSKYIGYADMRSSKLRKVAVAGGPPVTLCPAENAKGGSWNSEGEIIFAPSAGSGIYRVPAIGGEPVQLNHPLPGYDSFRHPRFLPGGQEYIFVGRSQTSGQTNTVYLASLDTTIAPRPIAESQANCDFSRGHLLTVREGVLMATPFDPGQERVTEGGTPLVENILMMPGAALGVFSAALDGKMVYQTGASAEAARQLFWTDLETGLQKPLGDTGQIENPVISPRGDLAVIEVQEASNEGTDLWLVDLKTGLPTRFTFAPGDEVRAVWSPTGDSVYYASSHDGTYRIMQQPVEGQGGAAIILETTNNVIPTSVSPDEKILLLNWAREDSDIEIRRLLMDASDPEPEVVASVEEGSVAMGRFSPDGRWIACLTTSAAGLDVFVMPAAGGVRKWQVTTDGAVYPVWTRDGKELFVSHFSGELRAYSVDGSGDTFRVGTFRSTVTIEGPTWSHQHYDLHPDGKQILVSDNDPAFRAVVSNLHLVTDWQRGLVQ
jgi:Tol biopolymer transport system component